MFGDNLKYLREIKISQQAADDLAYPELPSEITKEIIRVHYYHVVQNRRYFHVDLDDLLKHQLEQLHPKSLDKDFKILAITVDPANRQI
ncbi:MAG: hypothetical protein IPP42_01750 [Saprospiraceae bacterium]|nr:hypothetical protein [Saprospiraceae bacterium]